MNKEKQIQQILWAFGHDILKKESFKMNTHETNMCDVEKYAKRISELFEDEIDKAWKYDDLSK